MRHFTSAAASVALLSASSVVIASPTVQKRASLPQITVKGNAFFAGDERFYIRGLDYQPGGASGANTKAGVEDPIADTEVCKRDVEYFKQLGINTVRVYSVDNSRDHDECMGMLADAGIYLALDVNNPIYALNREKPGPTYNDVYLQNVFATIDAFAKYDNTLLFFSGNEVINTPANSNCAPYIKAVTRDMRSYIKARGYRKIPVGYSAADVEENRYQTAQYMNCGTEDERSDFFSFNDYSWCDPSDIKKSGWLDKAAQYKNYSIPLFLSEYGCIKGNRQFQEVAALYGPQMTPVYSGGLVYEYSMEENGYGIVNLAGGSVKPTSQFGDLEQQLKAHPSPNGDGGYTENNQPSPCPAKDANWDVEDDSLPAIPEPAKKYFAEGAGKPVGLDGPGSMYPGTGTTSPGPAKPGSGDVGGSYGDGSSDGGDDAALALRSPMAVVVLVAGLVATFSW